MSEHASLLLLALYFSVSHCLGSNTLVFNDELYKKRFQTRAEIINYLSGKTLVTERLSISSTTEDDIDQLAQYFTDEEYLRMYDMSLVWPKSIEEAKEHLRQRNISSADKYFFTVKITSTNTSIGQIGFDFTTKGRLWVCYWLAEPYQKKGYMSEICLPMVKFCFDTCEEFSILHIRAHEDNISSQNLAKKICSFVNKTSRYRYSTYEETIEHYSDDLSKTIRYSVVHFKLFKDKI
ncbi:MAG: GNAT family N-acetyltransferase [Cytophagales bacterium]|nr:GNAT family N-acetyltransferase [Cytophagales bacterium]